MKNVKRFYDIRCQDFVCGRAVNIVYEAIPEELVMRFVEHIHEQGAPRIVVKDCSTDKTVLYYDLP